MKLLYVFLGGGAGCVLRFMITMLCANFSALQFPVGTALVNIAGSFFIGLLAFSFIGSAQYTQIIHPLLIAGFLGGFTTFSAFSFDTLTLYNKAGLNYAIFNIVINVVASLLGVWLGEQLAKHFLQ